MPRVEFTAPLAGALGVDACKVTLKRTYRTHTLSESLLRVSLSNAHSLSHSFCLAQYYPEMQGPDSAPIQDSQVQQLVASLVAQNKETLSKQSIFRPFAAQPRPAPVQQHASGLSGEPSGGEPSGAGQGKVSAHGYTAGGALQANHSGHPRTNGTACARSHSPIGQLQMLSSRGGA